MLSDDDIDRAILAALGYNSDAPLTDEDRAIYRAGYRAGMERAACIAECSNKWPEEGEEIAAAIRREAGKP